MFKSGAQRERCERPSPQSKKDLMRFAAVKVIEVLVKGGLLILAYRQSMRVVFAALFVLVGMFAAVTAIDELSVKIPSKWMGPVTALILFPLIILALRLFNRAQPRGRTVEEQIADMKSKGLIVEQSFRAVRAFQAEEYGDEGIQYFIELEDGSILFLGGQYLYDYELIDDDPEINQPRQFPCTEFTIQRHKKDDYVVRICCGGKVIEPDVCVPPLRGKNLEQYGEDGLIIRDKPYDVLKAELMKGKVAASGRG